MKIFRNLNEITKKEQMGRRLSLIGLSILFVGMFASFVPNWYPPEEAAPHAVGQFLQIYWPMISLAALPIGFACASFGSYFIQRFARRRWPNGKYIARPDEMLERSMKGFDDKYTFYAYNLPANYVLVGPCGVLTFVPRSENGTVNVQGDRFREPFSLMRIFTIFAREGVRNLTYELQDQRRKMEELLTDVELDGEITQEFNDIPVESAAIFLNSDIQLNLENADVSVIRSNQVKEFVRAQAKEIKLSTQKIRAVTDYLNGLSKVAE